jgi:hypothetical protein
VEKGDFINSWHNREGLLYRIKFRIEEENVKSRVSVIG